MSKESTYIEGGRNEAVKDIVAEVFYDVSITEEEFKKAMKLLPPSVVQKDNPFELAQYLCRSALPFILGIPAPDKEFIERAAKEVQTRHQK